MACGSGGLDIFDISDASSPALVSNFRTDDVCVGVSVDGSLAYLAEWNTMEVVDVSDPGNPTLVGWEDTPTRAMGLAASGGYVLVADWYTAVTFQYGDAPDPDVYIQPEFIDFTDYDTTLIIWNTGESDLDVEVGVDNLDFQVDITSATIKPGMELKVNITYFPPLGNHSGSIPSTSGRSEEGVLYVLSNDPEEPFEQVWLAVDTDYLIVGDIAPDFELADVPGSTYSLSDQLGKVTVLAFYASW